MSTGTDTPTPEPATTGSYTVVGAVCTIDPAYPPSVTPGQGGYPRPEGVGTPHVIPPGCAPGLPTIVFAGPWQH